MIVVDTNVVSELMRPSPSSQVRDWLSAQAPGELYTTAVTVAEIRYGLERLPDGRRKDSLLAIATEVFAAFSEFVEPFDADAAVWYATIVAHRDRLGPPIDGFDAGGLLLLFGRAGAGRWRIFRSGISTSSSCPY